VQNMTAQQESDLDHLQLRRDYYADRAPDIPPDSRGYLGTEPQRQIRPGIQGCAFVEVLADVVQKPGSLGRRLSIERHHQLTVVYLERPAAFEH